MKQPKLMDFRRMHDIFEPHLARMREHLYISSELGIVYGNPGIFRLVLSQKPPFTINDYRLGVLSGGSIRISVNLQERQLTAGTLVFLGPGTIINPIQFTGELEIYGIALFPHFPMPFPPGQMPPAFNGQVRDFQLPTEAADIATARSIIDAIWQAVHSQDYCRPAVSALAAALMHHYDAVYQRQADTRNAVKSHQQTVFDRYLYLVHQHCPREHRISFYAAAMCLTERYLGTVIRQASGVTAKEWIDRAILLRAKAELIHTNKTVAQIADELAFAGPSFFCKFFRRLTGMSPQEYREQ